MLTFQGTVRLWSEGRKVHYLDYEAYPEMAEGEAARNRRRGASARGHRGHRDLPPHRQAGDRRDEPRRLGGRETPPARFDACLYTIERIKKIVPIWKKEVWDEGEAWVGTEGA